MVWKWIRCHNLFYFWCQQVITNFLRGKFVAVEAAWLSGYFSDSNSSVEPGHKCCSNCRKSCKCGGEQCDDRQPFFKHGVYETPPNSEQVRELSETDLTDIKLAMEELQQQYSAFGSSLFHPESSHGFSIQLIENIIQHAPFIHSAVQTFINVLFQTCHGRPWSFSGTVWGHKQLWGANRRTQPGLSISFPSWGLSSWIIRSPVGFEHQQFCKFD